MTILSISTDVSSYVTDSYYDTTWTSTTEVTVAPAHGGQVRHYTIGSAFDAIHDGCIITEIQVLFFASKGSAFGPVYAYASFLGVQANANVTEFFTAYSATGGSGTLPSVVRAGEILSSCNSDEELYNVTVTMSLPDITITYTDNGVPHTLFFGGNF